MGGYRSVTRRKGWQCLKGKNEHLPGMDRGEKNWWEGKRPENEGFKTERLREFVRRRATQMRDINRYKGKGRIYQCLEKLVSKHSPKPGGAREEKVVIPTRKGTRDRNRLLL